jgi:translocation and assembly module TamB
MAEEEVKPEEVIDEEPSSVPQQRRSFFARRNFFILFAGVLLIFLLIGLAGFFAYRFGYLDNYIKTQFVAKLDEIGVVFSADVFQVRVNPLRVHLENATFNDKLTGDRLFRVGVADLTLSVKDLYAWQLSRDLSIDTTELKDVEAWVKFDAEGKSNFSNLKLVEDEGPSRVNVTYSSLKFALENGVVHFGDVTRKIDANAKNMNLYVEPENYDVPDEQKRYKLDFASTDSNIVYDGKPIEPVNIGAKGIFDKGGAEITGIQLTSPLGEAKLNGNINDWSSPKYNLNIESTIDLVQTANLLPNGTVLRGFGNFKGVVTGEGERYNVKGEITSDSLAAANVRLKALQINADVSGEGSMYNANGKAVAEMLTFEDFRIDLPQLVGNVRGEGTNFKWVGELQAASLKSPNFSLASLFISDAVAEYKDEKLLADLGTIRAGRFLTDGVAAQDLLARNIKLNNSGDTTTITAPNVRAGVVKAEGIELRGANANNIKVTNRGDRTDVTASNVRAQQLASADGRVRDLNANNLNVTNVGDSTSIKANNIQVGGVDAGKNRVGNITAGNVDVQIRGSQTNVQANNVRVAKVETDAAILGSVNVAGVRLSIREGRVEGSSSDINAGNVTLTKNVLPDGGTLENVQIRKPVFVLEPSGRYRASLDLSLGGGAVGSVRLGAARAGIVADNDKVAVSDLSASVMDGSINGNAVIAMNNRITSKVDANFTNLDLGKLLALQGGKVVPIAGQTNGQVNLTFAGTNFKTANGTVTADFNASAGTTTRGLVPVNGRLGLRATNGLFNIDYANLNTEKTAVTATGQFDLDGFDSNLQIALNSTDASEIDRLIRVLNVSPELEAQLDEYQVGLAGNLTVNGTLTGNIQTPTIQARAALDSLSLRQRELGSLATNIFVSPDVIELRDGKLQERNGGGNIAFNVSVPQVGTDNISVQATLTNVNTGNLLAALPVTLPEGLRGLSAQTSGSINVTGLPSAANGTAEIKSTNVSVSGQSLDSLEAKATFAGNLVNLENFNAKFGDGSLQAKGTYRTDTQVFDADVVGKNILLARVVPLFAGNSADIPKVDGLVNLTAKVTGEGDKFPTYNVNFNGSGQNIVVNEIAVGNVAFNGNTVNQQLNANVTLDVNGQQQTVAANLNFADENLPFRAETVFNQTQLGPFIAIVRPPVDGGLAINGVATGRVFIAGNLYTPDASGNRTFNAANLSGEAQFSQLALQLGEISFAAVEPVSARFNMNEVVVNNAKFAGGGSNVTVNGTIGLNDTVASNFAVDGRINLRVLNILSPNTFFGGLADVAIRLSGAGNNARLVGSANLENSSFSTFIASERLNLTRINGQILFNTNQIQISQLTGYLGGGRVSVSGGAVLSGLQPERFRFAVSGQNITAPITDGFLANADAELEFSGYRENGTFNSLLSGNLVARRSVYNKDIELADIISGRRNGSISAGSSSGGDSFIGVPKLDIRVEGREALVVRNNIADVRASISLRVTGDVENPVISGRVSATEGTVFFRNDRYEIQRAVIEFPPGTDIEPVVNLQAETEIAGYQVIVSLVGSLTDTENLTANLRSSPALPQADVISLITTGSLANSDSGIPTLAQSGINTAAELITDSIINEPLRKATDRLFGLNRFEIDPNLSGRRLNPSARLTVGRQINRNLAVTYSTNLSEDQNQILALEYRVSNRLSFVAQYEQRPLSNVTRRNNNFNFEIRLRKRF